MAGFCSKCGSSLPESTGFCPACGTPVAAASAPSSAASVNPGYAPVATPVTPTYPAPTYPAPPPVQPNYSVPPPARGGGALKIVLIVIAVIVGLGILAACVVGYGIYRVKQAVHLDNKGNATISTLGGSISAGKDVDVSAADLGVPLYPGATRGQGGMKMTLPTGSMNSVIFLTNDSPSDVVAFYKGKLGENEVDTETSNGSVLSSGHDSTGSGGMKNATMITVAPASGNDEGKTQITIVRTVSAK
jgi:hypothetical protein